MTEKTEPISLEELRRVFRQYHEYGLRWQDHAAVFAAARAYHQLKNENESLRRQNASLLKETERLGAMVPRTGSSRLDTLKGIR